MLEIQASSGVSATGKSLQELLDSEDFDEAEYDKAMQQMFSEQYYEVNTPAPSCGVIGSGREGGSARFNMNSAQHLHIALCLYRDDGPYITPPAEDPGLQGADSIQCRVKWDSSWRPHCSYLAVLGFLTSKRKL